MLNYLAASNYYKLFATNRTGYIQECLILKIIIYKNELPYYDILVYSHGPCMPRLVVLSCTNIKNPVIINRSYLNLYDITLWQLQRQKKTKIDAA